MANQNEYYNVISKENFNDDLADALMAAFDIHEVDSVEELPRFLTELWKRNLIIAPRPGVVIEENISMWFIQVEKQPEEASGEEVYQLYDRKTYYGNPIVLFEKLGVHGVIQSSDSDHFKLTSHDESIVITATSIR